MGNGSGPTPEFQREAVRLALTSGRTMRPEWRRHATIRALGAARR